MAGVITVVGLGPGDPGARTVAAQRALDAAERIILRTAIHPGLDDLISDLRVATCDDLYERLPSFDALYTAIVERVLLEAAEADVVYAVPGHPTFGERTIRLLHSRAAAIGITVLTAPAVSALDEIAVRLGRDPLAEEWQLLDAPTCQEILDTDPFAAGLLALNPYRPVLVGQVYSTDLAAAVKLTLTRIFPDDHEITVVTGAGVPGGERIARIALHALDREPVDHLTSIWIPPLPPLEGFRVEATLMRVIAHLRTPGGCPWDRKQTHASLRDAVLNEASEAVDAIDRDDVENLAEELGDLLLVVALHTQIATEAGDFTIEDVYEGLTRKLIRRHPHVFGDVRAETPADVVKTWNRVKAEERGATSKPTLYQKLPRAMPVLRRAAKLLQDERPDPMELSDNNGPGEHLLSELWLMLRDGVDPERELERTLAERYA